MIFPISCLYNTIHSFKRFNPFKALYSYWFHIRTFHLIDFVPYHGGGRFYCTAGIKKRPKNKFFRVSISTSFCKQNTVCLLYTSNFPIVGIGNAAEEIQNSPGYFLFCILQVKYYRVHFQQFICQMCRRDSVHPLLFYSPLITLAQRRHS